HRRRIENRGSIASRRVRRRMKEPRSAMQGLEIHLAPRSHSCVFACGDSAWYVRNLRDDFSFPLRAGVVAARKRGERRGPASLPMNFVLVGLTALGGIKLGTVRGDSTPRARTATTFTPETDKDSSKQIKPGRAHRGFAAEPPRPGLPPEGTMLREGQGGPR